MQYKSVTMRPIANPLYPAATRVAVFVMILFLAGCSHVHETGRRSLQLMPESQLAVMATDAFNDMKRQMPVSNDPVMNAQLRDVGYRIVDAARARGADVPPPEQWEFVLFEDDQVNAFAMPGGKVGFYTGIFELFESEDDLAVVMGHEVAHVTAGHGNERVSQQLLASGIGTGLGFAMREQSEGMRTAVMVGFGLGSQLGVLLPFSRAQESEADHIGLIYSSAAGFDPRVSVSFWERMDALASGGGRPPEFLSTHPSGQTRIRRLHNLIPEVMPLYLQNQRAHLGPVFIENVAYFRSDTP